MTSSCLGCNIFFFRCIAILEDSKVDLFFFTKQPQHFALFTFLRSHLSHEVQLMLSV